MGFIFYVTCTSAIIGGWNDSTKDYMTYATWELSKQCKVKYISTSNQDVIKITCKDGELFTLPASQCSISKLKAKNE